VLSMRMCTQTPHSLTTSQGDHPPCESDMSHTVCISKAQDQDGIDTDVLRIVISLSRRP
jgi:hypothetical protein